MIIHPLPFSSTYNLDWVRREWGATNRCCLLRILIPFNAPMVVIGTTQQTCIYG